MECFSFLIVVCICFWYASIYYLLNTLFWIISLWCQKINSRSNTASGKTSRQCEVGNASCITEGSIELACHPPYHRTRICPPQRCIPRCPCLWYRWQPSHLHLWPTLQCRACTNLHPWGGFPTLAWRFNKEACIYSTPFVSLYLYLIDWISPW